MNQAQAITAEAFARAVVSAANRVRAARDELCALDAAAGDGDLGATLNIGFGEVIVLAEEVRGLAPGAVLLAAGRALARSAPSTCGALMATAFIQAARPIAGLSELAGGDVAAMLRAAATGVAERGGAQAGERTILDAILGSAQGAQAAASTGTSGIDVLAAAAAAARQSADATSHMEPKHGRAAWVKDRARGERDAGAVAWAAFVTGLADGASVPESSGVTEGEAPPADPGGPRG